MLKYIDSFKIREYGVIKKGGNRFFEDDNILYLDLKYYQTLFDAIKYLDRYDKIFNIIYKDGDYIIEVKNYIGVICFKEFKLTILPKIIDKKSSTWFDIMFFDFNYSGLIFDQNLADGDYLYSDEIFINMLYKEIKNIFYKGVIFEYRYKKEINSYLKGKLNQNMQLKLFFKNSPYFSSERVVVDKNLPENMVLKWCIDRFLKPFKFEFEQILKDIDIIDISNLKDIIENISPPLYYRKLWEILKKIVYGGEILSVKGGIYNYFFRGEYLFEKYVSSIFQKNFNNIDIQKKGGYIFEYENREIKPFYPDMVLKNGDKKIIFDTKWKKIDQNSLESTLPNSDIYQIYSYLNFLKSDIAVLVLPKSDNFNKTIGPIIFDNRKELYISPFFIGDIDPLKEIKKIVNFTQ